MKRTILLPIIIFQLAVLTDGNQRRKKSFLPPKPEELTGSKEQRIEQNKRAIELEIYQIETEKGLKILVENEMLVEVKTAKYYAVKQKSKGKHVYVRPWVKKYLDKLSADHFAEFHKSFRIVSGAGARSLWFQRQMTTKGSPYYTAYAAKAETSLEESLHVRGIAIDISRSGMTKKEIQWMRDYLIRDKKRGIEFEIENEEEESNPETNIVADPIEEKVCYHIVVFPVK